RLHERSRPPKGCLAEGVPAFSAKLTCQSEPGVCVRTKTAQSFFSRIALAQRVLSTAHTFRVTGRHEHPHPHPHVLLEHSPGCDRHRQLLRHFFRYGEPTRAARERALDVEGSLDGEGEWGGAFKDPDPEKFSAPTVTDVAHPKMGFSVAWNDPAGGVLQLESHVAATSTRGDATRFTVGKLPDPSRVSTSTRRVEAPRVWSSETA